MTTLRPELLQVFSSKHNWKVNYMRYAIIIEQAQGNFSAYVPDLPGCVTTGKSIVEIEHNIHEAMELHLEGLRADGLAIPESSTIVEYCELVA